MSFGRIVVGIAGLALMAGCAPSVPSGPVGGTLGSGLTDADFPCNGVVPQMCPR